MRMWPASALVEVAILEGRPNERVVRPFPMTAHAELNLTVLHGAEHDSGLSSAQARRASHRHDPFLEGVCIGSVPAVGRSMG